MAERREPHVLFVGNRILGWKTYSRELEARLSQRDDIRLSTIWHEPSRAATLPVSRHGGGMLSRLHRPIDAIHAHRGPLGRTVRAAIRQLRPDIVHVAGHWPAAAMAWMPGAPPFTAALDATRANINDMKGRARWSAPAMAREAALCRRAAHLYPMSEWAAASLRDDCGVAAGSVRVMPPSVDLAAFGAAAERETGTDGPVNVIFVGNDFARKGGPELLAWVRGPLAGLCHLHIASHDPAARVEGPHVTAHGPVTREHLFGAILPRMDIFCLPTSLDMSPNVLAEAAAAGLPAVASRLGGIPGLIREGETGLMAAPGDPEGFVAALRRLATDPGLRHAMSRAARRHAAQHLDARANFDRLADDLAALATRSREERRCA
ncbi:glycosyltransferase family 4 protein [Roseisalinus antarcticus]|uniref:Glycogen synthase n=1 Tax=Roseisalinus antarcticus TaxID=254357 RepID=A0A1Y5THE2_9RHOB|nr:glycosyltransferase family 4 protein [Roseisalinus antarcticus]SLN64323.1 Glycogen synthase [Roseisalinus antarcticus]